jgi:hypothetical protein
VRKSSRMAPKAKGKRNDITAEEKYGRYALCFRITRVKSGVRYRVKLFSLNPVREATTFRQEHSACEGGL